MCANLGGSELQVVFSRHSALTHKNSRVSWNDRLAKTNDVFEAPSPWSRIESTLILHQFTMGLINNKQTIFGHVDHVKMDYRLS